jgi:hypothetical protein
MTNFVRTDDIHRQARVFLAANILVIYTLTVVAVAVAIDHFNPSLFNGEINKSPNILILTVWFLYYIVPVLLAIIFGLLFRPFWRSFRNLIFAFLTLQCLVSFTLCMVRWDYVKKFQDDNRWRKNDKIRIIELDPKYYDVNEDGFLDQLTVSPVFDFTRIRAKDYLLHVALVPSDGPFTIDGGGPFTITEKGEKNKITREFVVKPRTDLGTDVSLYVPTNFKIKFILFHVVTVDDKGKKLLRYTRWSPYLRETNWEGEDPVIYGDWILLDTFTTKEIFTIPAPTMEPVPAMKEQGS